MSRKRIIHEDDAYPLHDQWGQAQQAYSAEDDTFTHLYPKRQLVTQEGGELLIDNVYRRFAPTRQRPKLDLRIYGAARYHSTCGHYDVTRHTIWGPGGYMDVPTLIHEVAHSLTWNQRWYAHGPEFIRMIVELHCFHLSLRVSEELEDTRNDYPDYDVPDALKLGNNPVNVQWIRKKRRA